MHICIDQCQCSVESEEKNKKKKKILASQNRGSFFILIRNNEMQKCNRGEIF